MTIGVRVAPCLLLAAMSTSARAQTPTFATRTEAVRVDVLVTEDGRPVRGLGRGDFEVLDNGVPQEVDLASFEQIPLNVVLAIDVSDSVAGERLDHLRRAGHAMLAYGSASFLWALTAFTGGTHFEVESTKNLDQTFVRVLEEFRQRYLVSYTPRGVSRDGWHRLEVRVRGRSASVKARPGYLAGPSLIR